MKLKLKILNISVFLLALGIPFYNSQSTGSHSFGKPLHLVLLGAVLYFFMGSSFLNRNTARHTRLPFSGYYFLFTVLLIVSMAFTGGGNAMGMQLVTYYVELAIVYVLFSTLIFERSTINACYYGLMAGFVISVFIALMQFLKVPGFNMFKDDELNANVYYTSQADAVDVLRIWGPFGNALTFSYYLAVAGCLLFQFYFYVRQKKIIAWAVFGMAVFGISVTISRMALFSFLGCLALVHFLSLSRKKKVGFLVLAAVLFIGGSLYLNEMESDNPLLSRLNNTQDDFKGARLNLWETGYKTWLNDVFLGTGPGNLNTKLYENGWRMIQTDTMDNTPGHVENYYLTLLFTFGLIAFFFYLMYIVKYLRSTFDLLREGLKNKDLAQGIPLFGTYVCLILNNLTNPAMHFDVRLQVLMILPMAMANNLYKQYLFTPGQPAAPELPYKPLTV